MTIIKDIWGLNVHLYMISIGVLGNVKKCRARTSGFLYLDAFFFFLLRFMNTIGCLYSGWLNLCKCKFVNGLGGGSGEGGLMEAVAANVRFCKQRSQKWRLPLVLFWVFFGFLLTLHSNKSRVKNTDEVMFCETDRWGMTTAVEIHTKTAPQQKQAPATTALPFREPFR